MANAATAVANARRYEQQRSNVERLADMLERRGEYVGTMVHDLKAPLTAIVGYISLMQRQPDRCTPELREASLRSMRGASDDLLEMIESILRGASAESAVDVRREEIDLLATLRELADLTAPMAQGRDGVARTVDIETDGSQPRLLTDPGALRSVVPNLLENAVKYSPPGSPVTIRVRDTGNEVAIGVTDRGDGTSRREATIFERFRQRRAMGAGGVGLGLYIVRSLGRALWAPVARVDARCEGSTWVALPTSTTAAYPPASAAAVA